MNQETRQPPADPGSTPCADAPAGAGALPAAASAAHAGAPLPAASPVPGGAPGLTKEAVLEALKPIVDPEIRLGIVDLGLIYDVHVGNEGKSVEIQMTLTTPMCPYGPMLMTQVQDVANTLPGVQDARIMLVWEPPWDPRTMASDYAKDRLGIW